MDPKQRGIPPVTDKVETTKATAPLAATAPYSASVPGDEHIFLIGRPPLAEYIGFIQAMTVDGQNADLGALANQWRAANDHILELERKEKGYADNPAIAPVPQNLQASRQKVLDNPMFQKAYGLVPTDIGIIELDRLVVYQKHINLDYVRVIEANLGKSPNEDQVFRLSLPFDETTPAVQVRRLPNGSFVFVSPSNDLRVMDAVILGPAQVAGYQSRGPVAGVVGVVVGFTANCLTAVHADNRLILHNGSHRAFALRNLGLTHAPCLIQRVSRREELPVVLGEPVAKDADLYLKADRPPLLKDYFDPKLRKVERVPKQSRQVKIVFGSEAIDI
jgi:hypothetical protein